MESDVSRKRRRFARTCSPDKLLSLRSLMGLILLFMLLLFVASGRWLRIPAVPASFRPVLDASSSSRWSFSSSRSILDSLSRRKFSPLIIGSRIIFPDHVLFIVGNILQRQEELDCFYFQLSADGVKGEVIQRPVMSKERFDEFQSVARCELPPQNYSVAAVELRRRGEAAEIDGGNEGAVHQWDKLVYEAVLDGEMAVVFAKGLNLRPHRESNPAPFSCHFSLQNSIDEEAIELNTKAITAAQEIIRCPVPRSFLRELNKNEGIRIGITVGIVRGRKGSSPDLLPSIAKIYGNSMVEGRREGQEKYELCACTMVWNQATALREWIMYHAWLGVERWFIYDNNSDDAIDDVIEELNSEHYNVSKLTWPWIKTQEAGFSHCAWRAKEECNWIGFFDVDEFFFFSHHHRRRQDRSLPGQNALRLVVSNFTSSTSIAELRTSCHSFGPSGLSSPPSQGVTVGYTCRLQRPERHKSFIRPHSLAPSLLNVIHHFQLKKEFATFNIPENIATINHYKYQVWEVFRAKFSRRVATYVVDWQEEQNQGSKDRAPGLGTEAIEPADWPTRFCEVWDTAMRDYVMAFFADSATGMLPWETRAPPFQ